MITLRPATPDDAETIHRFIHELAAFEREPHAVEATAETLRGQMESPRPPFECLIAELDGGAAGFALYFPNYSTWRGRQGLWLEDLYVSPRFRRRGVATALFRRVAAIALARGAGRLELSVLDWNEGAIAFYRKLGARALDEWTAYRLADRDLAAIADAVA